MFVDAFIMDCIRSFKKSFCEYLLERKNSIKKKGENNLPLNRFSQTYYIVKRNKKTQLNCTGIPQYIFLDTYTHHRLLFSL